MSKFIIAQHKIILLGDMKYGCRMNFFWRIKVYQKNIYELAKILPIGNTCYDGYYYYVGH